MKKIFLGIFLMLSVFVFASCSDKTEPKDDIELISFTHSLNSEYTFNDNVDLKIQIKNNNNYKVLSFQINDEIVNTDEKQTDYHDFVHNFPLEIGKNKFVLQKIIYEHSSDEDPIDIELVKNNTLLVNRNVGSLVEDNIGVSFTIKEPKETYYNGDKIVLELTFSNPKKYEIKTIKINGEDNVLKNNVVESTTLELTVKNGIDYFEASEITYIVDSKIKTLNFKECPKIVFPLSSTGIVPTDFTFESNNIEDVYSYSSTHFAVTVNKKISFKIKATNKEKLRLTDIILLVNGEKKKITKWSNLDSNIKYDYYSFDVSFNNSSSSTQNIKLDSIEYQDQKGVKYSNSFGNSKTYKIDVYDKVIKTYADFLKINDKLEGKYILGNNVTIDSTNKTIIGKFTGRLNGNGYDVIGGSHSLSSPIFESISTTASIENIRFVKIEFVNPSSNTDFACFTKTNNGTISNVTFDQITISNNSTNESTSTSIFVKTNNGTIKDVYLQTSTVVSNGSIYGICKDNYGKIERVIANYGDFKPFSTNGLKEIYFTVKSVDDEGTFINSYFENGAGRNAYYRLTEGANYILGPNDVGDTAKVSGIYYNGNFKTTSEMWTSKNYTYEIKNECKDKWFEDNITEVSNANARKESFYNSVLGFNAGSDDEVVWKIEDGKLPKLSNSYSGK